ncbi:MAG: hypothetical protein OSB44_00650 [Verrucomicrobiales bacterium]|nr:hypothetical protein [Verrucomicrobiales bacterium]
MSSDKKKAQRIKGRKCRFLFAFASLVIFVGLSSMIWKKLQADVWAYFSDEAGNTIGVEENKVRRVLWQDPKQNLFNESTIIPDEEESDSINAANYRLEAAFSPNGTSMVFVRPANDDSGTDLFLSVWDGRTWSVPEPVAELNSLNNERGPAFSRDGNFLYFSSDREGGKGGYDIYVSRNEGTKWSIAQLLNESINTPQDELGPAPAEDGKRLFFSSNRKGNKNDIYVARKVIDSEIPEETEKVLLFPVFSEVKAVNDLNSKSEDLQASLTSQGNHIFLASDRDRDQEKGFSVYLSRVVNDEEFPPEKIDLYMKKGDATDPAIRMEGFDLLFSTDLDLEDSIENNDLKRYRLYRSTTREVFGFTDLTSWEKFKELMSKIIWWILLAIAALIGLIYLLEHWRDISTLYHKCLAGSAIIHLLALLLMMVWLITKEFSSGGEVQAPEIAISIDALAQEELALESTPEEAQVAESSVALLTDKLESDFKIPVLEPQKNIKTNPIVASTSKTSLITDVRASKENAATTDEPLTNPKNITPILVTLPETLLPEPESPELDERDPVESQKAVEPANPLSDLFRPTELVPQVETEKTNEKAELTNAASESSTETDQIEPGDATAETKDTEGELIVAHRGLEAKDQAPPLDGSGTLASLSLKLPGSDPETDPLLPGKLETPKKSIDPNAFTKIMRKQRGRPSLETIEQLGGSDATERAILNALEWLSRNQEPNGRWDTKKHGGNGAYDTASTGLALLCYYGWGASHNAGGKYQNNVRKGIEWLVSQQKENGDLRGGGRMYCHGIAAIALCEAYGVSKDEKLRGPAEKAINLILAAQSPTKGGWRYDINPGDSDTSVTGWQYMALHSARMAGIEIEEKVFTNARKWFDHAGGGKHGGMYGYTGPEKNKPAMVATGMFCRQLDLVAPTEPRMAESAEILKMRKINVRNPDYYYLYYGTLALYQHQGPIWTDWNERIKETLPLLQKKNGSEKGSWDNSTAQAAAGGRVVSTTLATLSLEVYYRLLPMYGFRNKDANAPARKIKGTNG